MAPILIALALLAQDGAAAPAPSTDDGPMATQTTRKQDVAPLPIQGGPVTPPTDDYGYVAWCFGAISGYVELYDRAMPEVIRIERAWPTPSTEENIKEVYPAQKRDAIKSLQLFRRAIEATEKASTSPIGAQGAAAMKKGRAVWTGATSVPPAQLAQFWMSWAPPAKCEATAKALEARSTLFGQALTYNAGAGAAAAPVAPVAEPAPATAVAETPAPPPAAAPLAEESPAAPAAEVAEAPTPVADAPAQSGIAEAPSPAPADEPVEAPATETASAESAIDGLLPTAEPEPEAASAPEPEAPPPPVAKPVEAPKPAPAAATPEPTKPKAKPTKKPGLRDTLKGLRGPQ